MKTNEQLRGDVRRKYAEIARTRPDAAARSCCGPASTCAGAATGVAENAVDMIGDAYAGTPGYVAEADLGLGCGLPVEHAGLRAGQTVLDLGCGAGLDVFVARNEIGPEGWVIGVDMTADMIAKARENTIKLGFENVDFRLGEIENLPVRSDSVDVVISNCVLNLVPDKQRAFAEIHRVLKPGGHFCISDIVASRALPAWVKGIAEAYASCVSGALPRQDYLDLIAAAGFADVEVRAERRIEVPDDLVKQRLTPNQQREARQVDLHVMSVTVTAAKPG
jgi:SAM-dependent methyltransferase